MAAKKKHGQAVVVTVREEDRSEVTASPGLDAQKPWQLQAPLDVVCHRALGENWRAAKEVRALSNNREPATCTISTMVPSADRSCAHKNRKIRLSKGDRQPEFRKYHTVIMASARTRNLLKRVSGRVEAARKDIAKPLSAAGAGPAMGRSTGCFEAQTPVSPDR